MVKIINYLYEPSSSIIAQGNDDVIRSYKYQGYYIKKGGYGTYRMNKPSTAKVKFIADNVLHIQSVKQLIRDYYGVQRVTRNKLEQFVYDCNSGEIDLKYSDEFGLYI